MRTRGLERSVTDVVPFRARVSVIDTELRRVTAVDGGGGTRRYYADEWARNFDRIAVGDEVVGTSIGSLAIEVRAPKPGETPAELELVEAAVTRQLGSPLRFPGLGDEVTRLVDGGQSTRAGPIAETNSLPSRSMSGDQLPGTLDVIGPDTFARSGYPHAAWRRLREEAPVHWFDLAGGVGFWAIVKRDDIVWISKQPKRFRNAPRLAIFEEGAPVEGERTLARHLLNMDPPEHGDYRQAASHWFTPRAVARRQPEVERITRDLLAEMAGDGSERTGDFVADLAAPLTLHVLADMLGVPRADWRLMFRWTNQIAGATDSEYQTGDEPIHGVEEARHGLFAYFTELAAERRKAPRDDIVSVLSNATVGGAPMPAFELLSFFLLLVVAGNETTRNAASGGLLALIDHPDELAKLRAAPSLVPTAVEEIVRWTSPVIQFCRTPIEDVELRGQQIRKGDSLCLLYPSANRDADAFAEPDRFRVDRRPNPHLGFGIGEHFCLGANLARLELRAIFAELATRLETIELAGPVERMRSSFLGGVKRMPIRYRLRAL